MLPNVFLQGSEKYEKYYKWPFDGMLLLFFQAKLINSNYHKSLKNKNTFVHISFFKLETDVKCLAVDVVQDSSQ